MLTFFLLYGSMHLYAFLKARAALAFSTAAGIGIGLFMLIMIFAPIIVRLSEKAGFEVFARLMSYIGYTWLGILFLFISASIVIDLYRLAIYSGGLILKKDFALSDNICEICLLCPPYSFFGDCCVWLF